MNFSKYHLITLIIVTSLIYGSCDKEAGEGGSSTIRGKVYARDYNSNFTKFQGEYYAPDEEVFIIYGDDSNYSDEFETNYNGEYIFRNLRKGKYTIFAYSKDSTGRTPAPVPVFVEGEITRANQEIVLPDINIYK